MSRTQLTIGASLWVALVVGLVVLTVAQGRVYQERWQKAGRPSRGGFPRSHAPRPPRPQSTAPAPELTYDTRFGIVLPRRARPSGGGSSGTGWDVVGSLSAETIDTYAQTAQFYRSKYAALRPTEHVLQTPARLTSFYWRDKYGLAVVVVKPAEYPSKRTSIKITRLGMLDEPAPAGTGQPPSAGQLPETVGIPVYPGATVQYCGYVPGAVAKTARAQYEVNASYAEVQRFYRDRMRGGGGFSSSGTTQRMDWDDGSSYVNCLICQPDPALPTLVVFTRVGEAAPGWNTVREDPMRHWQGHRPFGPTRYRYDAETGWTSIAPPGMYGDAPPPVFGVDLYPGARVQYGTMTGDDQQSSGQILLVTEDAADRVVAFYAQKYQRARPRQQNAMSADGPKTALDWSDRDGIYTVLVAPQQGYAKGATYVTIVRTMKKAEAAASAQPVPAQGIAPEELKLPIYPGARVHYSGYLPGLKDKTAAAEFEVQAPYEQVAAFYQAKSKSGGSNFSQQLLSTEVKGTTLSWSSHGSQFTADIRQADANMPTLVRLRRTDTETPWRWPFALKSHQ